ncbi:uncharacterized protein sytl2a isoform 2-T3 [Aulostomus maculatus]
MIDLSFLTEEEQETILAVLKRDAELKRAEEHRVQNLQRTVNDKGQLRYLTGEWFYETKQLRHQDRIHGSDIIRASMRRTYKPLTILELSKILPEEPSFVSSDNKEVFVPPLLSGLLQEPHMQSSHDRDQNQNPYEMSPETPKPDLQSPTKQRKNPFNSELVALHLCEGKDGQLSAGAADDGQVPQEEPLPSTDNYSSFATNLTQEPNNCPVTQKASVSVPTPTSRGVSCSSQDGLDEVDTSEVCSAAPRGILKQLPMSSSIDSLLPHLEPQSPDFPAETWIDKKQVRFSSMVGRSGAEWQDGKELGEHSLLDVDVVSPCETEKDSNLEIKDGSSAGTHWLVLEQSHTESQLHGENICGIFPNQGAGQHQALGDIPDHSNDKDLLSSPVSGKAFHREQELDVDRQPQPKTTDHPAGHTVQRALENTPSGNSNSKSSFHGVSPKPRQRLLGIFRSQKEKTAHQQGSPLKEPTEISKMKDPENTSNLLKDATNSPTSNLSPGEQEAAEMTEVRTLQLTALQKTHFKDVMISVNSERLGQFPERLSSSKAEKDNNSPKIIPTREQGWPEDITETGTEASDESQSASESRNYHFSAQTDTAEEQTACRSQEESSSPKSEFSMVLDVAAGDGTYRANPVLIYEETDDSLTGSISDSQIHETQGTTILVGGDIPEPLCGQSSPSPQEDRTASISDLKHFWEKGHIGSRVPAPRGKEAREARRTLREKSEEETQMWHRHKSSVSKISKVTEKSSASPERSQLRRSAGDEDAQPTCHQVSPSKSKQQGDEVRRSPSKTCHPKVLPRESSSPKSPRLEGSPLKTFPIDINPQIIVVEERGKPTPVPRQQKSPSHKARQTDTKTASPPSPPADTTEASRVHENTQQSGSRSSTAPLSKKASEDSETSTCLARSFIPQDYQHYLGPHEKAHVPPFDQDKESPPNLSAADTDGGCRPQNTYRNLTVYQRDTPTEGNPTGNSSWMVQSKENANQEPGIRAWSLSWASSGNSSSPSSSSLSQSKQMKTSVSAPVLQQDETDSDSTSETLGWRRNTGSSMSNISLSSGMASMSSVSGSISSIYPADFGDVDVQGSIQYAVNYIQKLGEFHIFVVLCRDLAVADGKKNRSDPYVKCYLLPDVTKLGKRKTTVKKKTLNPTYNEILRFKIKMEVLKTQSLNISVWHNDTFGRNSFLGEVDVDMSEWDFSNTQIDEYALKPRVNVSGQTSKPGTSLLMEGRGHMRVALRFLPQTSHSRRTSGTETGEVQIWVKDCKNLPPVRGVVIDPFVKCTVLPDTSRKSRQKTRVVKRTANPMFNHTMVYDGFRSDDLREACVEITVWDHDRLNNHYIGGLRLGLGTGTSYSVRVDWMDSTSGEAHLWERMLRSDGEWVEGVLPLRMLVMAKSMSK